MSELAPAHRVSWFAPDRPVEGTVYRKPPADEQARADGQYTRPSAELGDLRTDPPMVVRVHPDDDPASRNARRAIKTDQYDGLPWTLVTGHARMRGLWLAADDVATWPVQHPIRYASVFRHAAADAARTRPAAVLDGADAEGAVPFKEAR